MNCVYAPSHNPRSVGTCVKCGRPEKTHRDVPCTDTGDAPRDFPLERYLTSIAAQAAGYTTFDHVGQPIGDTFGLDDFADARALPGGVRHEGRDFDREVAEELADARNYLVWKLGTVWTDAKAGESEAAATYERLMRCLAAVVTAHHEIHTKAA